MRTHPGNFSTGIGNNPVHPKGAETIDKTGSVENLYMYTYIHHQPHNPLYILLLLLYHGWLLLQMKITPNHHLVTT